MDQFCAMRNFCTIPLRREHYYLDVVIPLMNLDLHSLLFFFQISLMINFSIFYYSFSYRLPIVFYLLAASLEFYLLTNYLYLYALL